MEEEHFEGELLNLLEVAGLMLQEAGQMVQQLHQLEEILTEEVIPEKYEMNLILAADMTREIIDVIFRADALISAYSSLMEEDSDNGYESDGSV